VLGVQTIVDQAYITAGGGTIKYRVFDEKKEHVIAAPETRIRTDVIATGNNWLIPHIVPAWIAVNDTIEVEIDKGFLQGSHWVSKVVNGFAVGTDEDTEATNFDTVTFGAGINDPIPAGARVRLLKKAATALWIPVERKSQPFEGGESIEMVVDDGTLESKIVEGQGPYFTYASEDGAPAKNQDTYELIQLTAGSTGAFDVGARIRRELGTAVTMTQWPTVTPALAAWISTNPDEIRGGFEGKFPDILAGLKVGQEIKIEIKVDGIADVQGIFPFLEPVVEG